MINKTNLLKTTEVAEKIGTRSIIHGRRSNFVPPERKSVRFDDAEEPERTLSETPKTAYDSIRNRGRKSLIVEYNNMNPWA